MSWGKRHGWRRMEVSDAIVVVAVVPRQLQLQRKLLQQQEQQQQGNGIVPMKKYK